MSIYEVLKDSSTGVIYNNIKTQTSNYVDCAICANKTDVPILKTGYTITNYLIGDGWKKLINKWVCPSCYRKYISKGK